MINLKTVLLYGDSKSNTATMPLYFLYRIGNTDADLWSWKKIAAGGRTVATTQDNADSEIAAISASGSNGTGRTLCWRSKA